MTVVLLVHCDGTNGSTTFVDKSLSAHTLTPTAVTVETSNPKFGTGAASYTLGTGTISAGSSSDFWFDAGPFTIEAWCYATTSGSGDGYNPILAEWSTAVGNMSFFFNVFPQVMFFWSPDGTAYSYITASASIAYNTWTHVAADRDASNVLRVYVNGTIVASGSCPDSFYHSTYPCQIGNDASATRAFPGYLDEIRVTKGVAVYGGAFTPPAAPFPDPVAGSQYGKGFYGAGLYSAANTWNLAGNLAPTVTFGSSVLKKLVGLTGNLTPSVALSSNLSSTAVVTGALAPAVTLAGSLNAIEILAGGLIPTAALSGGLTITPATNLAGNFVPNITFGATLTTPQNIVGDLAPTVAFAANMSVTYAVAGSLAPQTVLGASLAGDWLLTGNMAPSLILAAQMISGPLWAASEPGPPGAWGETAPCPPAMWTPAVPPQWELPGTPGGYGLGNYGAGPYNYQAVSDVTPWEPAELCNGG